MDEKPDQIIGHIEAQRDELGRNLNELETRVRASTNWRTYYDKNPLLVVGAALGGGLLLGTMVSSTGDSTPSRRSSVSQPETKRTSAMGLSSASSAVSSPVTLLERRHVSETIDHIKAALIAFGIAKAKEFMSNAIPGLEQHLSEAEQRGRQHSSGTGPSQWQSSASSQERQPGTPHSWESAGAYQEPMPAR
jgi:hypothetical protein